MVVPSPPVLKFPFRDRDGFEVQSAFCLAFPARVSVGETRPIYRRISVQPPTYRLPDARYVLSAAESPRARTDKAFYFCFSWSDFSQQCEPEARFRSSHHGDVDGALGHLTVVILLRRC
jgi:hypothetical protein